ncbi:protein kinase domain-containing protein [Streptomyces xanthophaeus]
MEPLTDRDPAHIGAYALLARLGAGGMGQVYLGRSPGGRLVAVKVVREEITGRPEALARFRREVETVRAVRSAYTANLIDASLEGAPYWLATEYVAGPTLARAVGGHGPLPARTCRALGAALAEGLASVHAYGVTHRDLKPQNVILGAQGPQLIDFGIARGVGATELTQAGQTPGTPGYTAPEVLLGGGTGAAADVFALGATLAYAATGRPPFGAGAAAGVGYRAVHEPVDVAGVEPGLAALIEDCVAKDPAARPDPAEVIRRCGVRGPLVDDPVYVRLGEPARRVDSAGLRTTRPVRGPVDGRRATGQGSPDLGEREGSRGAVARPEPEFELAPDREAEPKGSRVLGAGQGRDPQPQADWEPWPRPARDLERESEPHPEPEWEPAPEPDPDPEPECGGGVVVRTDREPEPAPEPEREPDPAPEPEQEPAPRPRLDPASAGSGGVVARPEPEREPDPEAEDGRGVVVRQAPVPVAEPETGPEPAPGPEPERAPDPDPELEPERAPGPESAPGPRLDPASAGSGGVVARPEPEREPEPEDGRGVIVRQAPVPVAEPETGPEPDPEAAPGPRLDPASAGSGGVVARPEPEREPEPGTDPEPDPGPEPERAPDPGPEPDPEPERVADPEPDPGPEPAPEPAPEPEPARERDAEPDPEPDPDPVTRPGPGPEGLAGYGRRRGGRGGRAVWGVGGVGVVVGLCAAGWWLLPLGEQGGGGGAGVDGVVDTASDAYIEGNRGSRYRWTPSEDAALAELGVGQCAQQPEEQSPGTGVETSVETSRTNGVQSGSVTIRMRMTGDGEGGSASQKSQKSQKLQKEKPYYVSVAVKGPHGVRAGADGAGPAGNTAVGWTSRPVDVRAVGEPGEYLTLTYPEDFALYGGGTTRPAVPLAEDPGDWTVVFYHVEDDPTKYASIACSGFRVA